MTMLFSRRAFAIAAGPLALAACRPETDLTRMAAANDGGALNVQTIRVAGNVGVAVEAAFAEGLRDAVQQAVPRDAALPANALIEITVTEVASASAALSVKAVARLRSLRGFTRAEVDFAGSSNAANAIAREREIATALAAAIKREIAARNL